jgi:3-oxoacyl-[acyl-carrier protein] reductase
VAIQAAGPQMKEGGRIINIGSINADWNPIPGNSIYVATKAAVAGLTRGLARDLARDLARGLARDLARDLAPKGVTVNNIQPGPIDTDMNPAEGPYAPVVKGIISLGRYGKASEIASMVAYLASPEASFITGATINVDGGVVI